MKILLVHNRYNMIGGTEVFYHEVGRVLETQGHEVAYYSGMEAHYYKKTKWSKYFPDLGYSKENSFFKNIAIFPKMIFSFQAKKNLEQLISDFQPDVVHIFVIYISLTPSVLYACHEANIPVVMSSNEYKLICPNYKLFHHGKICEDCKTGSYYKAIQNRCCQDSLSISLASSIESYIHKWFNSYRKNIDLFLFASEFMAKKTEEFWGVDTFNWDTLKNPFESKKYQLSKEYDDYCLYFGRLSDEKGVDILIKAMLNCSKCKLKIIGDGPDEMKLKTLTSNLSLQNVEFCGPKWGEELNEVLKKARFVIVPSIWYENFPYVILQSFAWGKAVIGTNLGGIPELIIDGKYGLIYNADDPEELGNKILYLWENPEEAVSMGINAKHYVDENFNDEKFYSDIIRIYKSVM